ncbi:MAG: TIGR03618 family F420-dependent PPOX class oxidoreductase [Chloroflexi bacterium]|nr:TIGR03618 family F420-dependent PPOX class oxidoreductase [Chloroflexota bacterium]
MELSEVMPFLEENHLAVVTTVGASGKAQSTVVSAAFYDGKMSFVSRARTMKVKNVRRNGRCGVTVIRPHDTRYVTIEGPAVAHGWDDTPAGELLSLLRGAYGAAGRETGADDFESRMREEQRNVVRITPERIYGSI